MRLFVCLVLPHGFAGGNAVIPLEHPGKGENVRIADGQRGLAGGKGVAAQKLPGVLHAAAKKVLLGRKTRPPVKERAEIRTVQAKPCGQTGDGNILHVVAGQIGLGLFHIIVFQRLAFAEQGKQLVDLPAKE